MGKKEKITIMDEEILDEKDLNEIEAKEDMEEKTKKEWSIFGIKKHQIFAYFIIYSLFGYIGETLFAFLAEGVIESRQSFLYGPFCAIYGLGAVVMIVGLQKFKQKNSTLVIAGIILGAATEYLVSLIGEVVFGVKWWDYSDMAFNINGRICATYSLGWGATALIFVKYVNPQVDKFLKLIPVKTLKTVTSVIMIVLLCDWLISSFALEMFYVRLEETHHIELKNSAEDKNWAKELYKNPIVNGIVNTLWSDRVMVKTFPNLRVTTKSGAVIYVSNLYKDIEPYYIKVFEPVLFDSSEEQMKHK